MSDTVTSQNIDLPSWDTLYTPFPSPIYVYLLFSASPEST
jgi:hypothetical protein